MSSRASSINYIVIIVLLIPILFLVHRTLQKKRLTMSCAKLRKTPFIKPIWAGNILKTDKPKQNCGNNFGHTLYNVHKII